MSDKEGGRFRAGVIPIVLYKTGDFCVFAGEKKLVMAQKYIG